MTNIYIALDIQNGNNEIVAVATSKVSVGWKIVEWLKGQYTEEEWADFMVDDEYLSEEDMVRDFSLGLDVFENYHIAVKIYQEED